MSITRRSFLKDSVAGMAGAALAPAFAASLAATPRAMIRVGARQGSFRGDFAVAKRCGLDGVEVSVGGAAVKLQIADTAVRQKYKDQAKATGLVVSSLSMDLCNSNPVASDPRAPAWLVQTIEAAKDLGAVGILVPFFGKGSLGDGAALKKADVDVVVGRMKEVAPIAKEAHVVLGLENWLTATQNLEILDRIGSDAVKVWYDIGNSTVSGYDVPAEIRRLKGRLCIIHFKDGKNYLGEGTVKMQPVADAIKAIDYQGWVVLETACPSNDGEADCKRNVAFVRKLLDLPT